MKKYIIVVCLLSASFSLSAQTIKQKVDKLLLQMTLEEKIGQMTQLTLDILVKTDANNKTIEPQQLDTSKLSEAIIKYKTGSLLNAVGHSYTREQWFAFITAVQNKAAQTRLKIPVLYGIDAIHGAGYTTGATMFPQQIALAATFNTSLAKMAGEITAYETRASYIPWNFSPVLDLAPNPLWPRIYETFGEDPLLVKTMGVAMTNGYQGNGAQDKYHVAACMKHFLGYGSPASGKDRTPAHISDRELREYFLPSFQGAIQAGAKTLMINSGEINGVPVHASKYLLTQVLRKELGFKGIALTDWTDIIYLHTRHHVAPTLKDAVRIAVNAGVDMSMVPYDYSFCNYLLELVKEGKVSQARIDEAVSRILTLKFELGLFEAPVGSPSDYPDFGSEKFRQASLATARESITLLKNKNQILPLKNNSKILVTGPTANSMSALNGGWTFTWQGERTDELFVGKHTILQAIQNKAGKQNVMFNQGATFDSIIDINATVTAAQNVDVVVLCLGENSYTEAPGNIDDLNLPEAQLKLAEALAKTGKPIILVLAEGRPRIITKADTLAAATITTYLPGCEGGDALADILFGDINPSGKLPYTYPRYANALVNYYRKGTENGTGQDTHGYNPLYEFGHGLSYTRFAYSNLKIGTKILKGNDSLTITVNVKNTGMQAGKETVLLYMSDLYASITPSTKRLKAFKKIDLNPNEQQVVSFKVNKNDLSFIGEDGKAITEAGEFKIAVGNLSIHFNYNL